MNLNFFRGGIEYEQNKSNLLPYYGMTYNVYFQKMFRKLFLSLNSDWHDMQMINESARREDIDVSFKVAYNISRNLKVDADYMYRSMQGRGLDLEVHTARLEITSTTNKFYFSVGSDVYISKNYSNYMNYKGTYIQVSRNF